MRYAVVCAVLLLAACDASSSVPDGAWDPPQVDTSPPSCADLRQTFQDQVQALSARCDIDGDCLVVGGKQPATCACAPALPELAVNRIAYVGSDAARTAATFYPQCADEADDCDASPSVTTCVAHRCVLHETQECLQPPPDAAP